MVATDLAHVVWAVNMGCLGFHVWPYRADTPDFADELRIDLEPQPGVAFDQVREAAREVKAAFDELGMAVYIKTSGRRGLHVYSRLALRWDSYEVRAAAVAPGPGDGPAPARPDHRRLVEGGAGRRVFVDFNQNAPHKTVFGAWSLAPTSAGRCRHRSAGTNWTTCSPRT